MAKNYAETASVKEENRKPFGTVRIAKVTYDYHPIYKAEYGQSIGQMIDSHISETIQKGALVSEVSLFFETQEQQNELAEIYSTVKTAR